MFLSHRVGRQLDRQHYLPTYQPTYMPIVYVSVGSGGQVGVCAVCTCLRQYVCRYSQLPFQSLSCLPRFPLHLMRVCICLKELTKLLSYFCLKPMQIHFTFPFHLHHPHRLPLVHSSLQFLSSTNTSIVHHLSYHCNCIFYCSAHYFLFLHTQFLSLLRRIIPNSIDTIPHRSIEPIWFVLLSSPFFQPSFLPSLRQDHLCRTLRSGTNFGARLQCFAAMSRLTRARSNSE